MPGDAVKLSSHWWRLALDGAGKPRYRHLPVPYFPPQISQGEVSEAQFPPDGRLVYSFRDLSGGGGQEETPFSGNSSRYDGIGDGEGQGIDATLSPEGGTFLAAALETQVSSPAGTSNFLGVLWKGGSNTAYFTHGRYVYSWDGTSFTQVGDLGAGNAATDALLAFRGVQSADTWYAALGYGTTPKYSTDSGATWADIGTGGGVTSWRSAVVVDGDVVVALRSRHGLGDAMVASFNDGGATPTLFGVIDPIGDPAFSITRLIDYNGRILALKSGEGVFLLTEDRKRLQQGLFPELQGATIHASGAKVWRGVLWLPTDQGLYAIGPGFGLQQVGPEVSEASNGRGARGVIAAVEGDAYNLYGVRVGHESTDASVLYKANVAVANGVVQKVAWHPFLQLAAGAQCAALDHVHPGGVGHRLLIDLQTSAGAYNAYWIRLPGNGRDPRQDPDYRFCSAGVLYYSRLTARLPFANKTFLGVTPLYDQLGIASDGQTATTAQSGRNRYKLESVALTGSPPFGYTEGASQTSGSGVRDAIALRGRALDVAHRLGSSDSTTTPTLHSVTAEYVPEPSPVWKHEFTLEVGRGSASRAGNTLPDPATPGEAVQLFRALPASGTMEFVDPWDNEYDVTVPHNGLTMEAGAAVEEGGSRELPLLAHVVAVEQSAVQPGTYGALGSLTYGQLNSSGYTYSSLTSL